MSGKIDTFGPEWDGFCDKLCETLKNVGHGILDEAESTLDRDEGLRMLLRQLRYSTEREIEEHDLSFPVFAEAFTPTYHTLADAPDYAAYDALVDGNYDYRLLGQLGAANTLNFTTMAPASIATATPGKGPAEPAPHWSPWSDPEVGGSGRQGREVTGMLDTEDLQADDVGNFEVIVSSRRPAAGVWLPMSPATDRIVVRNVYHTAYRDHRRYRPAKLLLERIGYAAPPRTYSTEDLRAGLAGLLEAVSRVPLARAKIANKIRRGAGQFSNGDSFWKSIGSNPRTHFQEGYWALEPNEAMLIDVDSPPAASFWSVGLTNFWMESLDFRFFPVNLNGHTVTYNPDGGVRIVIAHRDPGVPNWLATAGHAHGAILWRWNDVEAIPALPRVQTIRWDGGDLLR